MGRAEIRRFNRDRRLTYLIVVVVLVIAILAFTVTIFTKNKYFSVSPLWLSGAVLFLIWYQDEKLIRFLCKKGVPLKLSPLHSAKQISSNDPRVKRGSGISLVSFSLFMLISVGTIPWFVNAAQGASPEFYLIIAVPFVLLLCLAPIVLSLLSLRMKLENLGDDKGLKAVGVARKRIWALMGLVVLFWIVGAIIFYGVLNFPIKFPL